MEQGKTKRTKKKQTQEKKIDKSKSGGKNVLSEAKKQSIALIGVATMADAKQLEERTTQLN